MDTTLFQKMAQEEVELALALACFTPDKIGGRLLIHAVKLAADLQRTGKTREQSRILAGAYYKQAITCLSTMVPQTTLIGVQDPPAGIGFRIQAFRTEHVFTFP